MTANWFLLVGMAVGALVSLGSSMVIHGRHRKDKHAERSGGGEQLDSTPESAVTSNDKGDAPLPSPEEILESERASGGTILVLSLAPEQVEKMLPVLANTGIAGLSAEERDVLLNARIASYTGIRREVSEAEADRRFKEAEAASARSGAKRFSSEEASG
jgi:hypothetical protein